MSVLLLRLDDITPTMNWDNFTYVQRMCNELNIKPIIGVVPDNQDAKLDFDPVREDFWEVVRRCQEDGWTIAQHGYRHLYEKTGSKGLLRVDHDSEFAGISLEEQLNRIKKGQAILLEKGIKATMFMAPAHSYDKNTLKALKKCGFESVTDGYTENPYQYMGLRFIPCKLDKPKKPKLVDTICLHINGMQIKELESIRKFIKKHRDWFVSVNDILDCYPVRRRNAVAEWKNIRVRNLKNWAAGNEIVQEYLKRTQNSSLKRMLGLPSLAFRVLFHCGK